MSNSCNLPQSIIGKIIGGRSRIQNALNRIIGGHHYNNRHICPECAAHIAYKIDAALQDVTQEVLPRIPRGLLISYCDDLLKLIKTCQSQICQDSVVIMIFREVYLTLYRL